MKRLPAYLSKSGLHKTGASLEEVTGALRREVAAFLLELRAVPGDRLHAPIAAGRWSPAEYADHLVRSTVLYTDAIRRTREGRPVLAYERGWLRDDGRMVTMPEAEPAHGRGLSELDGDLLAATDGLADEAGRAQDDGRLSVICMQNPFFQDVTVLEVVQLAAVHARHHKGHVVEARP